MDNVYSKFYFALVYSMPLIIKGLISHDNCNENVSFRLFFNCGYLKIAFLKIRFIRFDRVKVSLNIESLSADITVTVPWFDGPCCVTFDSSLKTSHAYNALATTRWEMLVFMTKHNVQIRIFLRVSRKNDHMANSKCSKTKQTCYLACQNIRSAHTFKVYA